MLKNKYNEFLDLIGNNLIELGYKKERKKGVFTSSRNGKIKKIEYVMLKNREFGEVRASIAVEYPALKQSILKTFQYQLKKNEIFKTYICNLPEVHTWNDFVFCEDTDMELFTEMVTSIFIEKVLPFLNQFDDDISIIKFFEYDYWLVTSDYASAGQKIIDYYFVWAGLCIINDFCKEAALILEYALSKGIDGEIKKYILDWEKEKKSEKQKKSEYLLTPQRKVFIALTPEEVREFLYEIDGKMMSYIIIVNPITQNYIQIAGATGEYIVEAREYCDETFAHYRYRKDNAMTQKRRLPFQGTFMQVYENEVVSFKETLHLILAYLENSCIDHNDNWGNITDMFL